MVQPRERYRLCTPKSTAFSPVPAWKSQYRLGPGRWVVRRPALARRGARKEEPPLTRVPREGGRALELRPRLAGPPELGEKVAAHARQEVIPGERGL